MTRPNETAHARALLEWYWKNKRDLPWRRTRDPYRILVSEILLQQTKVQTAAPYYVRFIRKYPTVHHLAQAQLDEILKDWQGLGYYRRAVNLHKAAQAIVRDWNGKVPQKLDDLKDLPGVGAYTAAAVASIAYGAAEPVLDGNSTRVLARFAGIHEPVDRAETRKRFRDLALKLLPTKHAGDFNQALMELGATVCLPKAPDCERCPLRPGCKAYSVGEQTRIPVTQRAAKRPHYNVAAGLIWKDGHLLIAQRKPGGMLGNMWEFPGGKQEPGESLEQCLRREVAEELAITVSVKEPFASIKHAYSHFRITLHVFHAMFERGQPKAIGCQRYEWVTPEQLRLYPFPAASLRVIDRLLASSGAVTQTPEEPEPSPW